MYSYKGLKNGMKINIHPNKTNPNGLDTEWTITHIGYKYISLNNAPKIENDWIIEKIASGEYKIV